MYTISANQHQWVENILLTSAIVCISLAAFYFSSAHNKNQRAVPLQLIGSSLLIEAGFFYAIHNHWQTSFVHHGIDYHAVGVPFNLSLFMIKWPIVFGLLTLSWLSLVEQRKYHKYIAAVISFFALTPIWLHASPSITLTMTFLLIALNYFYNWRYILPNEHNNLTFIAWCWLALSIIIVPLLYLVLYTFSIHESLIPLLYASISLLIIAPFIGLIFISSKATPSKLDK